LHLRKNPELPERKQRKDVERYEHAPSVVVVIAQLQPEHPKIPVQEQLLSAGCVAFNLLHGAHALGFNAQWLTGWATEDADVAELLGLGSDERIIAFVHLGTAEQPAPTRPRPALADKVQRWQP